MFILIILNTNPTRHHVFPLCVPQDLCIFKRYPNNSGAPSGRWWCGGCCCRGTWDSPWSGVIQVAPTLTCSAAIDISQVTCGDAGGSLSHYSGAGGQGWCPRAGGGHRWADGHGAGDAGVGHRDRGFGAGARHGGSGGGGLGAGVLIAMEPWE